jgi:hypothetical protein
MHSQTEPGVRHAAAWAVLFGALRGLPHKVKGVGSLSRLAATICHQHHQSQKTFDALRVAPTRP